MGEKRIFIFWPVYTVWDYLYNLYETPERIRDRERREGRERERWRVENIDSLRRVYKVNHLSVGWDNKMNGSGI